MSDNSDQFDFSPSSFSMTGANQSQVVTVYFTPTASGSKLGILTLSASGGDVAHVSLTGSGIFRPLVLTSSVNSIIFADTIINSTSSQTFTISAGGIGGSETVVLSDDSNQFDFSPASFSLTGGGVSQTVTAKFAPTIEGIKTGNLTLSSSGGNSKVVTLQGNALEQYFNNVSLLLKGDAVFTDISNNNSPITVYGDTKISTAQSKFGSSSILFDGNGDYITINNNSNYVFGNQNFTVETWINPVSNLSNGAIKSIFGKRQTSLIYSSINCWITYDSSASKYKTTFYVAFSNSSWNIMLESAAVIFPNAWTHLAYVRNGNVWTIYVNGISVASTTIAGTIYDSSADFSIGSNNQQTTGIYGYSGYMENIRVTKGIARYTSSFAPPGAF
jgi:hypothetical protein